MDWLGPVFTALISKLDPISLILLIIVGACGYYHIVWRREDREDRQKILDAFNKNTDALSSIKNVISASTGRPL
jgi:hypothetical protein